MTIEIKVPVLPESVADASIATWHKRPGDKVERDEVIVDIETDKVVLEVPAPEAGILEEILEEEGATVLGEQVIARLKVGAVAGEATKQTTAAADTKADSKAEDDTLSPAVRRLVAEHNIDATKVSGTGKGGRVTKEDVEAFIKEGRSKAAAASASSSATRSM